MVLLVFPPGVACWVGLCPPYCPIQERSDIFKLQLSSGSWRAAGRSFELRPTRWLIWAYVLEKQVHMWNWSTVDFWTSSALPRHVTQSRRTVIVGTGFKRNCARACVCMWVTCATRLHSIGQAVCAAQAGMQRWKHTRAACLAIWWRLLHHLSITHRRGKVGQMFSKVNHFFKRSTQAFSFLFVKKRALLCHLLVITAPLPITAPPPMTVTPVWPSHIKGRLSWGHKQTEPSWDRALTSAECRGPFAVTSAQPSLLK